MPVAYLGFVFIIIYITASTCTVRKSKVVNKPATYNYINPGYGLSLVDTLWNASSYRQPLEQEGNPMTWIEQFWLQISLIVAKKS